MKILAIDSCTNVATAALMEDSVLLAETVMNHKQTHSEKLLPAVESMLAMSGNTYADIDRFAVTVGPGSFTGQRIGIAAVKGIAFGRGACCIGVSALEAMAYNLPAFDGIICPIMNARREQVYNALFRWEDGILKRLCPDRALALSEVLSELEGKKAILLGDGVPAYRDMITLPTAPPHLLHLRGGSVAACGLAHESERMEGGALLPLYLRKSQAERELGK